ncbi:phosphotransferase (plasmid) [Sinorhizobium meliloti]|nr:phosphotransferase [Sinorhizobium meliloti]
MDKQVFEALSAETLPHRLGGNSALGEKIGEDASHWTVKEIGDGNLNLVFIVTGSKGTAVVKQALPYVRLVGESWPLPLKRSFFEYHALVRQAARAPGMVPEIFLLRRDAGADRHGVSDTARHPAPRADRWTRTAQYRLRSRPLCRPHAFPRLGPFHGDARQKKRTWHSLQTMSNCATSPKISFSPTPISKPISTATPRRSSTRS